jgi:hypothetical protein
MSDIFPHGPSGPALQPLVDFAIAGSVGTAPVVMLLKEANLVIALLSGLAGLALALLRIWLLLRPGKAVPAEHGGGES